MKGSPHFNPDPDAETLYKAMKGIGEWMSADLPAEGCASLGSVCSAPDHDPRGSGGGRPGDTTLARWTPGPEKRSGAPAPASLVYTPPNDMAGEEKG